MAHVTKMRGVLGLVALGVIALLDRVGDLGTLSWAFSHLPPEMQQRLMTNQAAAILSAVCFAFAFWLLWRDAGKGANALAAIDEMRATAKESNDDAWKQQAAAVQRADKYQQTLETIQAQQEEIIAKLDRLETERERSIAEIRATHTELVEKAGADIRASHSTFMTELDRKIERDVMEWKIGAENKLREEYADLHALRMELKEKREK